VSFECMIKGSKKINELDDPSTSEAQPVVSGTIISGTLKSPNSHLVTPISIKLQRPDGCD
jgi:hypothetical protein